MKRYLLAVSLFLPVYCMIIVCCTPSLHPLYTDEDVIFDEALIGVWRGEDAQDSWKFTRMEGEDAYDVVYTDENGVQGELIAHLVLIEDRKFVDFYPGDFPEGCEPNALYGVHLVPAHTFALVEQIEPTLRARMMDPDWLQSFLKENPDAIAHEFSEEQGREGWLVLTASTEELQAFVIQHIDTEGAYGEVVEFFRIEEGAGEEDSESVEAESD